MALNDPPEIAAARAKTDLDGDGLVTENDFQIYTDLLFLVMNYDAQQPPSTQTPTLTVSGRYLKDRCGNNLVLRGYEQRMHPNIILPGGSYPWLMDEIALTGANAVRLLPEVSDSIIQSTISRAIENGLTVDIHMNAAWFAQPSIKTMLQPYLGSIIASILGEVTYDDRVRWKDQAKAEIAAFRNAGYTIPCLVIANRYGRDLPGVLQYGPEIVASDPLGRTIIGWQAYWCQYYIDYYRMTLTQACQAIANASFPIQMGICNEADPGCFSDYQQEMALADQHEIGWLYWHYHNMPGIDGYNISIDGYHNHLMNEGNIIIHTDTHSFDKVTPVKACNGTSNEFIPSSPFGLVATLV